MRKYIIIGFFFCAFNFSASSQFNKEQENALHSRIEKLKKALKSLKGKTKVDSLNSIVDIYQIMDEDNQMQVDSACPYATQAYNEAKRMGYKRGLGYATLKLAYCGLLRAEIHKYKKNNVENGSLKTIEQLISNSIKISREIDDAVMTGSGYVLQGRLEGLKGYKEQQVINLKKGVELIEKYAPLQPKNTYREKIYIGDCNSCIGHEFRLGEHYSELYMLQSEKSDATENLKKAADYYQKSGARIAMKNSYLQLGIAIWPKDLHAGIENIKKAISYSREDGNVEDELRYTLRLCPLYLMSGNFENGIEYAKKGVRLAEKLIKFNNSDNAKALIKDAYYWMGRFYLHGGDFETALKFTRKAFFFPAPNKRQSYALAAEMGEVHRLLGNYDSAMFYLAPFATAIDAPPIGRNYLGNLYISLKQYDKALPLINESIQSYTSPNQMGNLGLGYTRIAKIDLEQNNYQAALANARKGLALLLKARSHIRLIENYQLVSDIFNRIGKYDSAYFYLKQYSTLKDSLLNRQLYIRLNDLKKEAEEERRTGQIRLLQKDNLIKAQALAQQILFQEQSEAQLALLNKDNEIKSQQLTLRDQQLQLNDQTLKEQQLFQRQKESALSLLDKDNKLKGQQLEQQNILKNALIAGLFLLLLLGIFFYRWLALKQKNERLKNEKKHAELLQQSAELEMQALRAQMNPHFIFNCLSSINKFILKNESRAASDYLTRFSRLIRRVLTNSQLSMIPLSDEIEMLKLYLDMERLRFDNSFNYNIVYANEIEPESIYVPPMLLQPFCENAIWHGLMHKDGVGKLDIVLIMQKDQLQCTISDNGVGRKRATDLKSKSGEKQKSFGLKITTERLALFNNNKKVENFYKTEDVLDETGNVAGTSVVIKIRYKDAVHELINS